MLAGGVAAADLKVVDLPTFTIALPDGEIKKQSPTPGTGVLVMDLGNADLASLDGELDAAKLLPPKARQVQVQWDATVVTNDEEIKMMLTALTSALPIKGARVLREKSLPSGLHVYLLGSEDVPIGLALTNCGTQVGLTITTAFTRDLDLLMKSTERIAGTVACKPDAVITPPPQVAYRLPKNFGAKHTDGIDILMSSEGEVMIAGVTPQDVRAFPQLFQQLVSSIFSQSLGVAADSVSIERLPPSKSQSKEDERHDLVLHTKGELDGARVNLRYCKAHDLSLFVVWYSIDPEIKRAEERFGQVGCPGESARPVVELAEMFTAECKTGNDYACEMVKEVGNF